jgi:hypothetical protein
MWVPPNYENVLTISSSNHQLVSWVADSRVFFGKLSPFEKNYKKIKIMSGIPF